MSDIVENARSLVKNYHNLFAIVRICSHSLENLSPNFIFLHRKILSSTSLMTEGVLPNDGCEPNPTGPDDGRAAQAGGRPVAGTRHCPLENAPAKLRPRERV
ncbi:hypothetical protein [Ferriphaselus amnicola]|uniref:hypothetical protein n=1 Tax=Ferriphaselus amnicola TaxID=1188319 RepID=UPI001558FEF2|nr:hypothetical protein [Ferriphaselus amnicola]